MPRRTPLIIAGIALAIPILLPLLVGTYAKPDPALGGIPFFYWYQFMLILVSMVLTFVAYRIVLGHERARRAATKKDRGNGASA